jgi:transcriptional regulator with XRE-family HTH domain
MSIKLNTVLKRLLKQKGITLKQLSNETGIKPSTLSGWSNGVSPHNLSEARACARYFGVSLERFLFDEESESKGLEDLLTEQVFDGYLKVKIERVIKK